MVGRIFLFVYCVRGECIVHSTHNVRYLSLLDTFINLNDHCPELPAHLLKGNESSCSHEIIVGDLRLAKKAKLSLVKFDRL
jgi:hypothetical protein